MLHRRSRFPTRPHHAWNPMASPAPITLYQECPTLGIAAHAQLCIGLRPLFLAPATGIQRKQQDGCNHQRPFHHGTSQRKPLAAQVTASRLGWLMPFVAASKNKRQREPSNSPIGSKPWDFLSDSRNSDGAKMAAPAEAAYSSGCGISANFSTRSLRDANQLSTSRRSAPPDGIKMGTPTRLAGNSLRNLRPSAWGANTSTTLSSSTCLCRPTPFP